jgi:hypothetical protein
MKDYEIPNKMIGYKTYLQQQQQEGLERPIIVKNIVTDHATNWLELCMAAANVPPQQGYVEVDEMEMDLSLRKKLKNMSPETKHIKLTPQEAKHLTVKVKTFRIMAASDDLIEWKKYFNKLKIE